MRSALSAFLMIGQRASPLWFLMTKDNRLTRILHGTLDELFATLVDCSRCGCGVFVTINTTDFRGRTKECIVEVRAYFADLDGAPIENIRRLDLTPHIITQTSPGRYGVYYM